MMLPSSCCALYLNQSSNMGGAKLALTCTVPSDLERGANCVWIEHIGPDVGDAELLEDEAGIG